MAHRLVQWQDVSFSIREHFFSSPMEILKKVTLQIPMGSAMGIIGANGAGKTTLLKIGAGILRPTAGSVLIDGRPVTDPEVRKTIGFLPESQYVYSHLKLSEWLVMMGKLSGMSSPDLDSRIEELLDLFQLSEKREQLLHRLSKGQLQRAGFAQALLHSPEILILDEPMSGMDPFWRHRIKEILLGYKQDGGTLVFSSHIISDVLRLSDEIAYVESGCMRWQGTMNQWPQRNSHYHLVFRIHEGNRLPEQFSRYHLAGYPDGSFGVTIDDEGKAEVMNLLRQDKLQLISFTPEYARFDAWENK